MKEVIITVLVGITNGENVWMGCDSSISGDNEKSCLTQPKIIQKEDVLIGVTGTIRGLQLLKYQLDIKELKNQLESENVKDYSDDEFIENYLVTYIKQILFENQYSVVADQQEQHTDLYMIGYKGKIYYLDLNYQIFSSTKNYLSIGSGCQYAYGSLMTQEKARLLLKDPEEAISRAITVAAEFCLTVYGEIKVFKV